MQGKSQVVQGALRLSRTKQHGKRGSSVPTPLSLTHTPPATGRVMWANIPSAHNLTHHHTDTHNGNSNSAHLSSSLTGDREASTSTKRQPYLPHHLINNHCSDTLSMCSDNMHRITSVNKSIIFLHGRYQCYFKLNSFMNIHHNSLQFPLDK